MGSMASRMAALLSMARATSSAYWSSSPSSPRGHGDGPRPTARLGVEGDMLRLSPHVLGASTSAIEALAGS